LNEYPVGITNATIRRGTPIASIDCIANGSAASEEVVENAINAGDLTARRKRRIGTLNNQAIGSSTTRKNTAKAPYKVRISFPRFRSTPKPLWPTVTAIAAPIPNGANRITIIVNLNITSASPSQAARTTSFERP